MGGDLVPLFAAGDRDRQERLGPLQRGRLGEVDDVDGGPVGGQQLGHRLVQRGHRPRVVERDRPLAGRDRHRRSTGAPDKVLLEPSRVAQRGRHEEELGPGQLEQRDLPGPTAVRLGVEVELVHDDLGDVRLPALAERDVREDLRGAAHQARSGIDGRVAGQHPDPFRTENVTEGEELLGHQSLDRGGVEGAAAGGEGRHVCAEGHQALARPGRGAEDDVGTRDDLDQRLLLRRVELDPLLRRPVDERLEHVVGAGRVGPRRESVESPPQ